MKRISLLLLPLLLAASLSAQTHILQPSNGGTGLSSPGASGNVLTSDGAGNWTSAAPGGGGGTPVYKYKTGNYTLLTADFTVPCGNIVMHSGTVTFPPSASQPAAGTCVLIWSDQGNSIPTATNGQTIAPLYLTNATLIPFAALKLVSDGTNFVGQLSIGPIDDAGNHDLIYGYGVFGGSGIGYNTMFCSDCGNASMGVENTLVGRGVGKNITGQQNTYVGFNSGNGNTGGSANVAVGISVGAGTSGSNNVTVGSNAGGTTGSGSNNTLLGYGTDVPSGGTSNYVDVADLIYGDKSKGILILKGPAASLSSCGTSPAVSSGSNDMTGEVTPGSGSPTSCTVSFANTHNQAPFCTVTPLGNLFEYISAKSASSFTVTAASGLLAFDYHCTAGSNSSTPTL